MNLTCESCLSAQATHLLVADLHSMRVKSLSCLACGRRDMDICNKTEWYHAWLYKLVPEMWTDPQEVSSPGVTWV
jgi:hypothetical protein